MDLGSPIRITLDGNDSVDDTLSGDVHYYCFPPDHTWSHVCLEPNVQCECATVVTQNTN